MIYNEKDDLVRGETYPFIYRNTCKSMDKIINKCNDVIDFHTLEGAYTCEEFNTALRIKGRAKRVKKFKHEQARK